VRFENNKKSFDRCYQFQFKVSPTYFHLPLLDSQRPKHGGRRFGLTRNRTVFLVEKKNSRPAVENQSANETLQPLSLAIFELQKFHTDAAGPHSSDHSRFDMDGMSFVGDLQVHAHNIPFRELGIGMQSASGHGDIDNQSLAMNVTRVEGNRQTCRHPVIFAAVFFEPLVLDTPLKELETMAAKLAPEGIDVEEAYQTLGQTDPTDTSDILAGTSGTKRSRH
jgi:hypothetical protein